jgi:hypothetical protein
MVTFKDKLYYILISSDRWAYVSSEKENDNMQLLSKSEVTYTLYPHFNRTNIYVMTNCPLPNDDLSPIPLSISAVARALKNCL